MYIPPDKQTTENNKRAWKDGSAENPGSIPTAFMAVQQPSVTSVPGDLTLFWPPQVLRADGAQRYMQAKYLHIKNSNKIKKKQTLSKNCLQVSEIIVLRIDLVGDSFFSRFFIPSQTHTSSVNYGPSQGARI